MRTTSGRIAGLLLLLALLLLPTSALAAPAITITPAAVPPGGTVTVTGNGFAPNVPVSAVVETAPGRRVPLGGATTAADGTVRIAFAVPASAAPGTVSLLLVAADATVLAQGQLTVTSAPPVSGERVSIAPAAGPVGTRFVATGTGFPAGMSYRLGTAPSATGPQTRPERQVLIGTIQVGADGRFTAPIDSTGYPPEDYDFVVLGSSPDPVFVAHFTVTAGGAPGLPNTGGGGTVPHDAGHLPLRRLPALAALVLLALAWRTGARRARRS